MTIVNGIFTIVRGSSRIVLNFDANVDLFVGDMSCKPDDRFDDSFDVEILSIRDSLGVDYDNLVTSDEFESICDYAMSLYQIPYFDEGFIDCYD